MQSLFGFCLTLLLLLSALPAAQASPAAVWQQAMAMAAAGNLSEAKAHLAGAVAVMPGSADDLWRKRMQLAVMLLDMRQGEAVELSLLQQQVDWTQTQLMQGYLQSHSGPVITPSWIPALLGTLVPGAGHAWQGRWRDAGVAAMLVIPMLLLTLWAARRRMGPVTLFFALICIWLWSGSVFSALSLAERGAGETYLLWWQGLWQAAALPGRPW
ncbi:MAG: hypothetical protein R8K50_01330 [Mariprofundus sp.]